MTTVVQVYYCPKCQNVYRVREQGVYYPSCPECGHTCVIHQGEERIETK